MKRTIIRILFLILFAGSSLSHAYAFDFSSACSTGQTLYYTVLSDSTVSVVYPNNVGSNYYSGYTKPSGSVQIPASVTNGSNIYSVVAVGNNAFYECGKLQEILGLENVRRVSKNSLEGTPFFENHLTKSSLKFNYEIETVETGVEG